MEESLQSLLVSLLQNGLRTALLVAWGAAGRLDELLSKRVNEEIRDLAEAYVNHGVVSQKYKDDALHVAACTVARIDLLVSWNLRHLVNLRREAGFNAVNFLHGYHKILIVRLLELIYDPQKEDI
jgi:hypothetical protein